jgi:hypothetical protein
MPSVIYITGTGGNLTLSPVCFGKAKNEARADQLVTFTKCLREAPPIKYRDLPRRGTSGNSARPALSLPRVMRNVRVQLIVARSPRLIVL